MLEGEKRSLLWEPASAEVFNLRFNGEDELLFSLDLELYSYNLASGVLRVVQKDPVGITGGVVLDDKLYYSTYTTEGYALRVSSLGEGQEVALPPPGETPLLKEIPSLESSRYLDWPRFNFWLPSLTDELSPGVSLLLRSPLEMHTILLSGGYSLKEKFFTGEVFYQLDTSVLSLSLNANFGREQALNLLLALPIYKNYSPKGLHSISALLGVGGVFESKVGEAVAQVSYGFATYSAPKDYYGRWKFSLGGAFWTILDFATLDPLFVTQVSVEGQIPLGRSHQAIELKLDTAISHQEAALLTLLPDYLDLQHKAGQVKGLVTLRYRLPFGLFDYPIPYGGLTAMGLTVGAQTALYIRNGQFDWEEDVYLSLRLDSDIAIGTSVIHPSFAVATGVRQFKPAFSFSLNLDFLIANQKLATPL
ncbi:MAG: hypothetical protein GX842_08975 [Spirochaetales bacterium]|nr:hypothetical protein [Spirochaetales bacterium]